MQACKRQIFCSFRAKPPGSLQRDNTPFFKHSQKVAKAKKNTQNLAVLSVFCLVLTEKMQLKSRFFYRIIVTIPVHTYL